MNIFADIPHDLPNEISEKIINSNHIRIERIISQTHKSPENFWYDQAENEWILLLQGSAKLLFNNNEIVEMKAGDYVNIPAHKKHRVTWTDPDKITIWLAIFY